MSLSNTSRRLVRSATRPQFQCLFLQSTKAATANTQARRWQSSGATDPKISQIVDQISTLTLMETASLVEVLKVNATPLDGVGRLHSLYGSFLYVCFIS